MKAKVNDWIRYVSGPHMKVGVVRYVLADEPHSWGKEYYQTDECRVKEDDVREVRAP